MPSKASRALYDIRDCILSAQEFTDGYDLDRFRQDRKTFHAVTRMLEIISEASRHLDPAVRDRHPELPWCAIRDSGNFYRHDYDNVAETYVCMTVLDRLPPLMAVVLTEIVRLETPT